MIDLCQRKREREEEEEDLPTSPGLTKPELTLRHGIEAAVLIILGASVTITGDPILSPEFEFLSEEGPQ